MPLSATISFTVPALPNSGVWFASSTAWSNYWSGVEAEVDLDAATTSVYAATAYDNTKVPCALDIDGVHFLLVTTDMLASLMARIDALNAGFELMRTQMKAAGFITEAQ